MNVKYKQVLIKAGKFLILPAMLGIAALIYSYTNLFTMSNITIEPLNSDTFHNVSKADILSIKSLSQPKRYFHVDVNFIKREVEGFSPFISSSFVTKELPNQLNIYILERRPFVALEINAKKCILLDNKGFVLDLIDNDCKEFSDKYKTIIVKSDDPKATFVLGTQSNYFQIKKMEDVVKIMNEYQIPVVSISLVENVSTVFSLKGKRYVFSFNQELEPQLARFIAVLSQLEKKNYNYKSMDLRFKRPVLSIK